MRKFAVVAGLCLVASSILAQPAPRRAIGAAKAAELVMRVSVDENGQIRQPSVDEIRQLIAQAEAVAPPSIMLRTSTNAQPGVGLEVTDAFDHAYLSRTNADGALVFTCTDDHLEGAVFVAQTAPIESVMRLRPGQQRQRAAERE